MLIDTHCHLNHPDFARDLPAVLKRARDVGVGKFVCVGYDMDNSSMAVKLAREIRIVYASVGIHPHDATALGPAEEELLAQLATDNPKVVAIGETGLDYYRNLSPRDVQQEAFRRHIRLAKRLDLPLIVHSREAGRDVLSILDDEGAPDRGVVMHCLPSDPEFADGSVARGYYVGIAGPVTFSNAEKLREIARRMPLDKLLVETDAPYLTPHPHRGERNEPAFVALTANRLAEVKGVSSGEIADRTTRNAVRLFGLDQTMPQC